MIILDKIINLILMNERLCERMARGTLEHYTRKGNERYLVKSFSKYMPENFQRVCEDKKANVIACEYYLDKACKKACNFYQKHKLKINLLRLVRR